MSCPLNVVIPLGKLCKNLRADGFQKPLQSTPLLGRPLLFWLIDNLQIGEEDIVWLIVPAVDEAIYQIFSSASAEYKHLAKQQRFRLVPLHFATRGVAESLLVMTNYMNSEDLARNTVCLNGDTIFKFNLLNVVRRLSSNSLCFLSEFDKQTYDKSGVHWSFCPPCPLASNGEILKQLEPDIDVAMHDISVVRSSQHQRNDLVCIGAYSFRSGIVLRRICQELLSKADSSRGNSGRDSLLNFPDILGRAILLPERIIGIKLRGSNSHFPLKTREMFDDVIGKSLRVPGLLPTRATRYVFELYGGLLDKSYQPRPHVLSALRTLKQLGHRVIISSSRGRNCAAINDLVESLRRLDVPYDEIQFPDSAEEETVIVGSNVVDVCGDLSRELGLPSTVLPEGSIRARHFNTVSLMDDTVSKTSLCEILSGEAFYYENIPPELTHMFPRLLSKNFGCSDGDSVLTIEITRVHGLVCSQLLVNRCIDTHKLDLILGGLLELHSYVHPDADLTSECYSNYALKVSKRYSQYAHVYKKLPCDTETLYKIILSKLEEYETDGRACIRSYIHGDPVLSNCIISREQVCFIDMNGRQGEMLTTSGDCHYDLAKLLQSLFGYDFIILDTEIDRDADALLCLLRSHFREHVERHYKIKWRDVQLITASLFFSLIPLHENTEHHSRFITICKHVLDGIES